MNPYLIIAALLAVMAAGAGGFRMGVDHEKASQLTKQELVAEAVDAANNAAATAISRIRVTNQTIRQEVERETHTNTVYVDCRHTPAGLSGVNAALSGDGGGKLPKADATER